MFTVENLSSFLLLYLSLRGVQGLAVRHAKYPAASCSHDVSAPIVAWVGDSCHLHLDPTGSHLQAADFEHGISCLAAPYNTKGFPISSSDGSSLDSALTEIEVPKYKERPIRQAQEQQILSSGPRSITLRWPDPTQHALFFIDEVCHHIEAGRPEFTWHVEGLQTQVAPCESPPAGLFRSVEFLNQWDYDVFSSRMRRQDGETSRTRWRGI
ncbi:MAG: hypothetical protein LQ349_009722, partial [Xanthoria aureola]